jgi:hypothetical protein
MLDSVSFYLQKMLTRFIYLVYPNNIIKLKSLRAILAKEIIEFVDKHIKEADPKYEKERILYSKEFERGDSEKVVLMRRNSLRKNKRNLEEEIDSVLEE